VGHPAGTLAETGNPATTATLKSQASQLPGDFSSAAGELESFTVSLLNHVVSAITVIVLAFFLLLEGPGLLDRFLTWLGGERERRGREIASGIYAVVRGYVTVNLSLAIAPASSPGGCSRRSASISPSRSRSSSRCSTSCP